MPEQYETWPHAFSLTTNGVQIRCPLCDSLRTGRATVLDVVPIEPTRDAPRIDGDPSLDLILNMRCMSAGHLWRVWVLGGGGEVHISAATMPQTVQETYAGH